MKSLPKKVSKNNITDIKSYTKTPVGGIGIRFVVGYYKTSRENCVFSLFSPSMHLFVLLFATKNGEL